MARYACFISDISERAVAVVVKQNVVTVVSDVQILKTVTVEISRGCPHTEVAHFSARYSGFLCYVGKCSIMIVSIERVSYRRLRSKEVRRSAVDEINIHPAVVVKIKKQTTTAAGLW